MGYESKALDKVTARMGLQWQAQGVAGVQLGCGAVNPWLGIFGKGEAFYLFRNDLWLSFLCPISSCDLISYYAGQNLCF